MLKDCMPELRKRGATHVYLRRRTAAKHELRELFDAAAAAGIMPIIPHVLYRWDMLGDCGVHFKSTELSLLAQYAPARAGVVTASSHGSVDARLALQAGARFVFVSPVYPPLSKPGDTRRPLQREELQKLIALHGEKIVLLGGMTEQRLLELKETLTGDFSLAGISFFFTGTGLAGRS
jgi:thiamine monophosphate synthase